MITEDNKQAFRDNEIEANKYVAKCMVVMAVVIAIVWILNILNIFIVPQNIMTIAAIGSIVILLAPTFLSLAVKSYSRRTKVLYMSFCVIAIALIAAAMPKHGIVAWAAPVALSCHYYSKRFTVGTYIASVVFMAISLPLGALYGEWDIGLFGYGVEIGVRFFDEAVIRRMFVFMLMPRALTLAGICAVCTTLSNRTHTLLEKQIRDNAEKQRIASELDIATEIQTSMLPRDFLPERKDFEIFASMHTAKEVGGDFYDFFPVGDDKLAFLIADVSGKGIPAAMFMMRAKSLIKSYVETGRSASEAFSLVNQKLCEGNEASMFVTAWLGIVNLKSGVLDYANAGHNSPLIMKAGGEFEYLKTPPCCALAIMEDSEYLKTAINMTHGDRVYLYTDGVTEAMNINEELYGEARLLNILNCAASLSPDSLCAAVKTDVDDFVGDAPQFDDITMLCFNFVGDADAI